MRQRGATLIVALLVVLIVVALATRISRDYFVLQRTLENENELQQSRAYLRGAEAVATQALLVDLQGGSKSDSALESWAQQLKLPLTDGVLTACLLDLQSRINLNDLATPASEGFSAAQKRFIRLLQVLPVDEPPDRIAAIALANAVFDWVDVDDQPRYPGGAESQDYLQRGRAWRPANQPLSSVTELALIEGFDAPTVAALTPLVSVWGNGKLNINTVDSALLWSVQSNLARDDEPQALLLRTLNSADSLLPLAEQTAGQLAAARSNAGGVLESLQLFSQPPWTQVPWDLTGIDIGSEFFQMTADMQTGAHHQRLITVLQRTRDAAGRPVVLAKSRQWVAAALAPEVECAAPLP